MESTYKFYMQTINKDGSIPTGSVTKDLEEDFKIVGGGQVRGQLRYKECKGLNTIGKPRVYTEKYADSDRLRTYIPTEITHDATTIKLTLYFMGENRQKVYDDFNTFVTGGYRKYWDTARNKAFDFYVSDITEPSDEKWYWSTPYFEVTYTLQNLNGKTKDV